jgi:beta-glucosidase
LNKSDFGESFLWGVSTAAYQIEGAHQTAGKGLSIWDDFAHKKDKVRNNQHGDIACDFYHKFPSDIKLISDLNIRNYRFSIAWSRILPYGYGQINQKGIDFYNRVIDICLEHNITPWITLYHWDLPLALERKGGWTNRKIIHWFSEFVEVCVKHFSDRVTNWMVLNEPMVFTGAGYFMGIHAPGQRGINTFLQAVHHATLCQGIGFQILKSYNKLLNVGTTFSCSQIEPSSLSLNDINAAQRVDALLNRLFIEPAIGLGYPTQQLKWLNRIESYFGFNDEKLMQADFDFIGIQNYTREIVKYSLFTPFMQAAIIPASKRNVTYTQMNWEVHPPSINKILHQFNKYEKVKNIIITENGAAFPDRIINHQIDDHERVSYLKNYLQEVLKAKQEGVKINGYFVWTLMDNFEWAEGYFPKFGLVHCNHQTQERIIKASGHWFKNFLSE